MGGCGAGDLVAGLPLAGCEITGGKIACPTGFSAAVFAEYQGAFAKRSLPSGGREAIHLLLVYVALGLD